MQDSDRLCKGCMDEIGKAQACPFCGYVQGTPPSLPNALRPGTVLREKYLLGRILGYGGFGITYIARDETLGIKLAIKEYFPKDCCTRSPGETAVTRFDGDAGERYRMGLNNFLEEARLLARFVDHPGIVGVRDFFSENGTAYLVMRYIEGITLREYLKKNNGRLLWGQALAVMSPVIEALAAVHEAGILHRDISPDNIFVAKGGGVKVLDFGAARQTWGQGSVSMSVILKPGYAPEEQYRSKGQQGPWSDVYACAATFYRCLTGKVPPESLDRLSEDTLIPPSRHGVDLPSVAEVALMKAMAVKAGDRFANMPDFLIALLTDAESETVAVIQPPHQTKPDPRRFTPPARSGPDEKLPVAQGDQTPQAPVPKTEPDTMEKLRRTFEDRARKRNGADGKVPPGKAAISVVFMLAVVLVAVGALIVGGMRVLDMFRSMGSIVPSTPTPGMAGSPEPTPPASLAPAPGLTPEATPEPTPEATPNPVDFAVPSVGSGTGRTSGRSASAYLPTASTARVLQYAGGDTILFASVQLAPGVITTLTAPCDENGAMIPGARVIEHYVIREGSLFAVPDSSPTSARLIVPKTPQVGQFWDNGRTSMKITGVNEDMALGTLGAKDVILIVAQTPSGLETHAIAPGMGVQAQWDGELGAPLEFSVSKSVDLDSATLAEMQSLSRNHESLSHLISGGTQ